MVSACCVDGNKIHSQKLENVTEKKIEKHDKNKIIAQKYSLNADTRKKLPANNLKFKNKNPGHDHSDRIWDTTLVRSITINSQTGNDRYHTHKLIHKLCLAPTHFPLGGIVSDI